MNRPIKKFRKKPVVIKAIHFFGDEQSFEDVGEFCGKMALFARISGNPTVAIKTLEGTSYNLEYGDWIICGIEGEFYPCKPDIFKKTYEEVKP